MLVSHHVEEIPPGFTHALLLREGRVVAAGPLDDVLTEENLVGDLRAAAACCSHEDGRCAARRRRVGTALSARAVVTHRG